MKKIYFSVLGVLALCVLVVGLWIFHVLSNLPDVAVLKQYRPAAAAEVLDKSGNFLANYYDRKFRIWIPLSSLPDIAIQAVVIAEDDTFFGHEGVNYKAVWEALRHDIRKKRFARGGSTITQQMIKNVLLSKEKTIARKVREFVLARKAEDILSKRRILEIYLNEVEWGENIYGIEAASRYYLDKNASDLTAAESALLAGMLPNPRYYNPFKRLDKANRRQEQVLFNMHQAKILTDEEYEAARTEPTRLRPEGSNRFDFAALSNGNGRACYQKVLGQVLLSLYGEHDFYRKGMRITTTLDKSLQQSFSAQVESSPEQSHEPPDRVTVLKEGGEIRAIACTSNEEPARSFLDFPGRLNPIYEVSTVAIEGIKKEEIILPAQGMPVREEMMNPATDNPPAPVEGGATQQGNVVSVAGTSL
jgi:monofunctional biosynthetic peptidoglycan transglycosylase